MPFDGEDTRRSKQDFGAMSTIRLAIGLLLCASAAAADDWRRVAAVSVVEVRIHWSSPSELNEIARKVGWRSEPQAGRRTPPTLQGFSVLSRNAETGAYVCEMFVVPAPRGKVTPQLLLALGHEMAHCLGHAHGE
jgi:hypothetical protein